MMERRSETKFVSGTNNIIYINRNIEKNIVINGMDIPSTQIEHNIFKSEDDKINIDFKLEYFGLGSKFGSNCSVLYRGVNVNEIAKIISDFAKLAKLCPDGEIECANNEGCFIYPFVILYKKDLYAQNTYHRWINKNNHYYDKIIDDIILEINKINLIPSRFILYESVLYG